MRGIVADAARNVEIYIVDVLRGQIQLIFKYLLYSKGFKYICKLLNIYSIEVT
jgi:hypothetical protein